jgi:hypothetical protein
VLAERTSTSLPDNQQPWWPSRYGAEDEIGSLNEITPAQIVAAARLVRQGRVFDLGRTLDSNVPHFPGRFWQQTLVSNAHLNNPRRPEGTDGAVPSEDPERPFRVPQTLNVRHGLFIMENLATEVIAQTGVYEFLFCLTHHKTRGSTGAVIAPAAVI